MISVVPGGIEPPSQAPETYILSVVLRDHGGINWHKRPKVPNAVANIKKFKQKSALVLK